MGDQKTRLECGYQWRHIGEPGEKAGRGAKLAEKPRPLQLHTYIRVTHDLFLCARIFMEILAEKQDMYDPYVCV